MLQTMVRAGRMRTTLLRSLRCNGATLSVRTFFTSQRDVVNSKLEAVEDEFQTAEIKWESATGSEKAFYLAKMDSLMKMRAKLTDKLISFDEDHALTSHYATDLSGADAVGYTDFIKAIGEENNFPLRQNPYDPGEPFAKNAFQAAAGTEEAKLVTWNRELVVDTAIKYFNEADGAQPRVVEDIGMLATLAARGCGKSHIVDALSRLGHHPDLFPGLDKFLVPICISFNGPQTWRPLEFPDPQSHVIARLVHRGFFDSNAVEWDTFCDATRHVNWPSFKLNVLFEGMITFFKQMAHTLTPKKTSPVILIAVDEVSMCGHQTAPAILDILKRLLTNNPSQCRLLVTTFDELYLLDGASAGNPSETTGSNRPIWWLVLNRLLDDEKQRAEFIKTQLANAQLEKRQLHYFVSLSGGHARSLALLKHECNITLSYTFADVLKAWQKKFSRFIVTMPGDNVIEHLLARTMLNHKIVSGDTIHETSVQELIRQTIIINSVDPQKPFVPQLSTLMLRLWSDPEKDEDRTPLKMRVQRLLELGEDLDWKKFEEFHLIFEDLRCWAWHELNKSSNTPCTTQTLGSWFAGGKFLCGGKTTDLSIPDPTLQSTRTLGSHIGGSSDPVDSICLAHTNQPGMDILQPMGNISVFYEVKHSEPQPVGRKTSTKLSATDLHDKADALKNQIEQSNVRVGRQQINTTDSVFVFVAHRDKAARFLKHWKEIETTQEFPIIVFDREQLIQRYGETFGFLCSFMLSYSDRNSTEI